MNQYRSSFLILITASLLVIHVKGCVTSENVNLESTLPINQTSPSLKLTENPEIKSSPTIVFRQTPTEGNIPVTIEPSMVPTSTWVPDSALTSEEAKSLVNELFQTNRDCLLPCWWGIVPGITTWQEANSFLAQFAHITGGVSHQDKTLQVQFVQIPRSEDGSTGVLTHIYIVKNGVIESIEVSLDDTSAFSLSNFLNTYGKPEEIWLNTYRTEYPVGVLPFLAALFYPQRGILATYSPLNAEFNGDIIRACQWDNQPSMLGLWSPTQKITFMETARRFRMNPDEPGFLLLPIEDATEISVQTFYEIFKTPGIKECLETPREKWPEQQ